MSTLIVTLLVAFVATVLAIASLAIGWLISGRSRIVRGSCGMDPHRKRDEHCGKETHCSLCNEEVTKRQISGSQENQPQGERPDKEDPAP